MCCLGWSIHKVTCDATNVTCGPCSRHFMIQQHVSLVPDLLGTGTMSTSPFCAKQRNLCADLLRGPGPVWCLYRQLSLTSSNTIFTVWHHPHSAPYKQVKNPTINRICIIHCKTTLWPNKLRAANCRENMHHFSWYPFMVNTVNPCTLLDEWPELRFPW